MHDRPVAGFEIHHCQNRACDLRFPVIPQTPRPTTAPICPRCGSPVQVLPGITHSVAASTDQAPGREPSPRPPAPPLDGVLDNLRSAFNVGSIFRIADGAGLHHLYLGGITATPAQPKVAKTALGAETHTPWSYAPNALSILAQLRQNGRTILALESLPGAVPLFEVAQLLPAQAPLALIVGNELTGIDPHLLAAADWIVSLPMQGIKSSLNVAVAFGIAAYWLRGIVTQSHIRSQF